MKTIFMGTPDFAVPALEKLVSISEVAAVFTQNDKKVGRKQVLEQPPVKECALKHGIKVYQPQTLKSDETFNLIKEIKPDLIMVAAYGKILPERVLGIPKYGCINIHASLLPKYRGASPIQYAILNGENETGVTVMKMDAGLDTGDIICSEKIGIGSEETAQQLSVRLADLGAEVLPKVLKEIEEGTAVLTPQPAGEYIYASMLKTEDSRADFSMSASRIYNQVRALNPWPGCRVNINGKTVKITKAALSEETGEEPGEVVASKKVLRVCCGDKRCIDILEVQPEGKKVMPISAFLAGNRVETGTNLLRG